MPPEDLPVAFSRKDTTLKDRRETRKGGVAMRFEGNHGQWVESQENRQEAARLERFIKTN